MMDRGINEFGSNGGCDMLIIKPALRVVIVSVCAGLIVGCNNPGSNNQNSSNNPASSRSSPATSNANKAAPVVLPAPSPAGGTIVVASTPPGAIVVLVREEEGSAGNPERKGSTPVTVNGVAPGKYSITLEKTGFKYFQKEFEVQENKTVKINANLKRG
jgi:hypothetical protein